MDSNGANVADPTASSSLAESTKPPSCRSKAKTGATKLSEGIRKAEATSNTLRATELRAKRCGSKKAAKRKVNKAKLAGVDAAVDPEI